MKPEKEYLAVRQHPRKSNLGMELTGHTNPRSQWLSDYSTARFMRNYPEEMTSAVHSVEIGAIDTVRFTISEESQYNVTKNDIHQINQHGCEYVVFVHSDMCPEPLKPYTVQASMVLAGRGF